MVFACNIIETTFSCTASDPNYSQGIEIIILNAFVLEETKIQGILSFLVIKHSKINNGQELINLAP